MSSERRTHKQKANLRRLWHWSGAVLLVLNFGCGQPSEIGPKTGLHYAPNHNFGPTGDYIPGKSGFNLADAVTAKQANALDGKVKALVWIGQCNGVTGGFIDAVRPFLGNPRVFGFYLMDDPDPRGRVEGNLNRPQCKAYDLKAESDWVHAHMPDAKTFIVVMNLSSSKKPSYQGTYNPSNSDVDLFGIDPYPCRSELGGCDYNMIDSYVHAAESSGIPLAKIVPVYQAFGGGWVDDYEGQYVVPTTDQECRMMRRWRRLVRNPAFDMAYSWGVQSSDVALETEEKLRHFFVLRNKGELSSCGPSARNERSAQRGTTH